MQAKHVDLDTIRESLPTNNNDTRIPQWFGPHAHVLTKDLAVMMLGKGEFWAVYTNWVFDDESPDQARYVSRVPDSTIVVQAVDDTSVTLKVHLDDPMVDDHAAFWTMKEPLINNVVCCYKDMDIEAEATSSAPPVIVFASVAWG